MGQACIFLFRNEQDLVLFYDIINRDIPQYYIQHLFYSIFASFEDNFLPDRDLIPVRKCKVSFPANDLECLFQRGNLVIQLDLFIQY
ncbi:hypothetical protein ES705_46220 [subsurface metagenome]